MAVGTVLANVLRRATSHFDALSTNGEELRQATQAAFLKSVKTSATVTASAAVEGAVKVASALPLATSHTVCDAALRAANDAVSGVPSAITAAVVGLGVEAVRSIVFSGTIGIPLPAGAAALRTMLMGDPRAAPNTVEIVQKIHDAAHDGATAVQVRVHTLCNDICGRRLIEGHPRYVPSDDTIDLDREYPQVTQDGWLVLSTPTYKELYRVTQATEAARSDFFLNSKTTRATLEGENLPLFADAVRSAVVLAQSEELAIAETPITDPISGERIVLASRVEGLEAGQELIAQGKRQRVQIAGAAVGLRFVEEDGTLIRNLNPGDALYVLELGAAVPGAPGRLRWHLVDRGGMEGYVMADAGQLIYVPSLAEDVALDELVTLRASEPEDQDHTRLVLTAALKNVYERATAVVFANVARATHGETVADEVLGDGDNSAAFQSFKLKKFPVTFVPQPEAPNGAGNSLRVRVNGIRWDERQSLYGAEGDEEIYTTSVDDDGALTAHFGDGETGARLPTGRTNVVANYRRGLGRAGNVRAGSLTTLLDRPLGVRGVTNPLAAQGGAEPESREQTRANAPNTVRTFGRIVSLRDFEDAAREYAGVARARAALESHGGETAVRLTVAGDEGAAVAGTVMRDLRQFLDARRDPNRLLLLQSYTPVPVLIEAAIRVDERFVAADVGSRARAALLDYLSFDTQELGKSVSLSDVFGVLQAVAGVIAADVNVLNFKRASAMSQQELRRRSVSFRVVAGSVVADPLQDRLLLRPEELAYLEDTATDAVIAGTMP